MHPQATRDRALSLVAARRSLNSVARELGVSRAAIRAWRDGEARTRAALCPRSEGGRLDRPAYAALLGYYLGDGCISVTGRTFHLRVSCDRRHPGVVEDVAETIIKVRGRGPVGRVAAPGCVVVKAYWNHWPCLFPQHGPGRKHERTLVMEPWQEEIVAEHPGPFLRGLFHSDGYRVSNWTTRIVAGEPKRYTYSRWQFVNHSPDIRRWCTEALDRIGVPWRQSNSKTISVSRRDGVRRLDEVLGPKS